MLEPERPNETHLRSKLETYKLIMDANKELMDKNISTRDELAAQLVAAQCFLDILEWTGDETNHSTALKKANQIVS